MKKVTGIGGIFFKSKDPEKMKEWYRKHLGIESDQYGATFEWGQAEGPGQSGYTAWSVMPEDTKYFDPSSSPFMINYRVDDLHALLKELREAGVEVDDKVEEYDYGKFGWIMDPEGRRIELWEPNDEKFKEIL